MMIKQSIKKVAVLGSGIMGSRIACHFANIGVRVLLLDKLPDELDSNDPAARNKLVNTSLEATFKSNPSPLYSHVFQDRIETGNLTDHLPYIADVDWIIEAVVEDLTVKKQLFDQVEQHRKPGTLITSNTSGIPIHLMAAGRSKDFKQYFCGSHFFNPPRYLRLLEIIPTADTKPEVVDFLMHYGDLYLGKTTVRCKDTPAFIGNRIGVYWMLATAHLTEKLGLTIEEVDAYTGAAMGRPKSATFRTADLVGLDTLVKVTKGLYQQVPEDEAREIFQLPAYVQRMMENNWLGDKSQQGFYKKLKDKQGKSTIQVLDLQQFNYKEQQEVRSPTLKETKKEFRLSQKLASYVRGEDQAGALFRALHYPLFEYVSKRIPEITDDLFRIDDAMRAGFGWELGPFELWDLLGVKESIKKIAEEEKRLPGQTGEVAGWVKDMLASGHSHFYKIAHGRKWYYDIPNKAYKEIPGRSDILKLDDLRADHTLWENDGVSILDLGDGILNAEIHTKMNAIDTAVIAGLQYAIAEAERAYKGLVITNDGPIFSAGANIGMLLKLARDKDLEALEIAVKGFQDTAMQIRYAAVPVVVAPFNLTLGGGCELAMHADFVQLHAETYMGLVEFGVGIIPAGGGSKEFALRAAEAYLEGQHAQQTLRERFLTIGQAKVSTSAIEALTFGYLEKGKFAITMNRDRLLIDAKNKVLELANAGYTPPIKKGIKVLGSQGLGMIYAGAASMQAARYISAYDRKIAEKLGWVLCGGNLSEPVQVSEDYLLKLEREQFLSLAIEEKTIERLSYMLTEGKPLRN